MSSELAFRAQLILREQRDLYDYWRACARSRPMAAPQDIDPVAIPHLLPGLSLLDAGKDLDTIRYRLAGTRVREIYGIEVTGRSVFTLDLGKKSDYWRSVYRQVVMDVLPMQGVVRSPMVKRDHLMLFWLRLPLGGEDGKVQRILGYDAALPSSLALGQPTFDGTGAGSESRVKRFFKR
jgi:hypothetical protein